MKYLYSILMLLSVSALINVEAESLYDYNTNNDGTITITGYKGPLTCTELMVPKTIDGKTVTKITKLISKETIGAKAIERVSLPPQISTSSDGRYLIGDLLSLRCGLIETGSKFSAIPFYYTNTYSTFNTDIQLECIISFSSYLYQSGELIGSGSSEYLMHLGSVLVKYTDESYESINFYNWGSNNYNTTKLIFDQSRYNHLLWALEQHLVYKNSKMEVIESIDFRGLTNTIKIGGSDKGVTFTVSDYFPDGKLPSGAQVFLPNDVTYTNTPTPYTITDLQNFTAPSTSQTISGYSRSNTQQWNSVCLPFDIIESDFPVGTHIYTLNTSTSTAEEIHLSRCTGTVSAGTPCMIYSENPNWDLSFETEPRTVRTDVSPQTQQSAYWLLCGSFTTTSIGQNFYKLNNEGNAFSITTSAGITHPFRCYLKYIGQVASPARVQVLIDD